MISAIAEEKEKKENHSLLPDLPVLSSCQESSNEEKYCSSPGKKNLFYPSLKSVIVLLIKMWRIINQARAISIVSAFFLLSENLINEAIMTLRIPLSNPRKIHTTYELTIHTTYYYHHALRVKTVFIQPSIIDAHNHMCVYQAMWNLQNKSLYCAEELYVCCLDNRSWMGRFLHGCEANLKLREITRLFNHYGFQTVEASGRRGNNICTKRRKIRFRKKPKICG